MKRSIHYGRTDPGCRKSAFKKKGYLTVIVWNFFQNKVVVIFSKQILALKKNKFIYICGSRFDFKEMGCVDLPAFCDFQITTHC